MTDSNRNKAIRIVAATWLGIASFCCLSLPLAYSCASCGSGGEDPLILYPNESDKILVGAARTAGLRNIDKNGSEATAGGPTERHAFTLAYGHSFSMRSFATLTLPMLRNAREGTAKTAMGDPSFATRYTLHMASLTNPWVPQVQILAGFKPGLASLRCAPVSTFGWRSLIRRWAWLKPSVCRCRASLMAPHILLASFPAQLLRLGTSGCMTRRF